MQKFLRWIISLAGLSIILMVGILFVKSHATGVARKQRFESLKSSTVVSIELDQYQRGTYDQSGNPTGKRRLAVITDTILIKEFKNLVNTNIPKRWNHFGVVDTYRFSIATIDGRLDFDAVRTGRPTDLPTKDLWVDFGGNEGAYVPNLYKWIESLSDKTKTGR